EVAPLEQEWNQYQDGDEPLRTCGLKFLDARQEEHHDQDQDNEGPKLNQVVDQDGDKAAADSGQRKLERHEFRRLDAQGIPVLIQIVQWPALVAFSLRKATRREFSQVT